VSARSACANAIQAEKLKAKPKKGPVTPAPVALLRKMIQGTGRKVIPDSAYGKPTDADSESYNVHTVKAVRDNDVAKLRSLLNEGQSLNACNRFGESLLHMACRRGNLATIRFLLEEAHVSLHIRDDFGRTPLHDACWTTQPHLKVLDLLLTLTPPSMWLAEDVRGHTPFHYAPKRDWDVWVEFLEERKEKLIQRIERIQTVG